MSDLLSKSRENRRPEGFVTDNVAPVLDAYISHFDGDVLAAQVALIEDMFNLMKHDPCSHGNPPIAVVLAVKGMSG